MNFQFSSWIIVDVTDLFPHSLTLILSHLRHGPASPCLLDLVREILAEYVPAHMYVYTYKTSTIYELIVSGKDSLSVAVERTTKGRRQKN